jgi:hypothetical protein
VVVLNEWRETMMARPTLRFAVLVGGTVLFAAFVILFMGLFSAKEVSARDNCTLKTIKGTYLFEAQGTVVQEGKVLPYAEAGTWTLDGKGNAAGIISGSIDGVPFATRDAFTATYKLETGCTYSVVDAFDLHLDLYAAPDGKTMTYFSAGFSGTQYKVSDSD